jgi:hypothetical protein
MAGGMDRIPRGPLAERLGWDRQPTRGERRPSPNPTHQAGPNPGGARHCWVVDSPALPPGRWPGLLVEWRRDTDGWSGHVVVALPDGRGPMTVSAWVAAEHLRPC